MIGLELALAAVMTAALILYFLFGGADFGGGVWDLFASGPRKQAQRALIERAIGPVWEANHVWLILVVVILFSGFPRAFAALSVAFHVPLTLFVLGVVFRGSAFAFRSYEVKTERQRAWGRVFSWASIIAPILLGMVVGGLVSGEVRVENGTVRGGFFAPWLSPFAVTVGLFALALVALLAATYLAKEATDTALAQDFRWRALGAGVAVGVLAALSFALSADGAPRVYEGLTGRRWTWPFHAVTGVSAVAAFWTLWTRRYGAARVVVDEQMSFILIGWALSQFPYLVVPDLTLTQAAANPRTLKAVLVALALGAPVLFPSLWFLFRVFKSSRAQGQPSG